MGRGDSYLLDLEARFDRINAVLGAIEDVATDPTTVRELAKEARYLADEAKQAATGAAYEILDSKQVAGLLRLTDRTVRRMAAAGEVESLELDGRGRIGIPRYAYAELVTRRIRERHAALDKATTTEHTSGRGADVDSCGVGGGLPRSGARRAG